MSFELGLRAFIALQNGEPVPIEYEVENLRAENELYRTSLTYIANETEGDLYEPAVASAISARNMRAEAKRTLEEAKRRYGHGHTSTGA